MKDILLPQLETRIRYHFLDPQLAMQALTHRSHYHEVGDHAHNERLEFLGDSVLNLLVGEMLMDIFPDFSEGELSKLRASFVSESYLAKVASTLDLGPLMRLGRGEGLQGGRERASLLADAVEAVLGAVFIDSGGVREPRRMVREWFALSEEAIRQLKDGQLRPQDQDFKSRFQELCQKNGLGVPQYVCVESSENFFVMAMSVLGAEIARARGTTKKEATQRAASLVWENFQNESSCGRGKLELFIKGLHGHPIQEL